MNAVNLKVHDTQHKLVPFDKTMMLTVAGYIYEQIHNKNYKTHNNLLLFIFDIQNGRGIGVVRYTKHLPLRYLKCDFSGKRLLAVSWPL